MGVYNGEPKASAIVNAPTDQMQIYYNTCEMRQWKGSVSKVNVRRKKHLRVE